MTVQTGRRDEFGFAGEVSKGGLTVADGLRLLVTELLPGGTLASQSLTPPAACAVVLAAADALMHAHAAGVLHRDVKPANILFTADGRPKLTDLGVVGLVDGTPLTAGKVIGTAQYLAPEQVTGSRLGPATDVHASRPRRCMNRRQKKRKPLVCVGGSLLESGPRKSSEKFRYPPPPQALRRCLTFRQSRSMTVSKSTASPSHWPLE